MMNRNRGGLMPIAGRLRFACAVALCMALMAPFSAPACTGFAVYGDQGPVYGMNFDFYEQDYSLCIVQPEGHQKMFSIYYESDGIFADTPMLSERGMFSTVQMLWPEEPYAFGFQEGEESVASMAMWAPYVYDTVGEIKSLAHEKQPGHILGSFHSLYADMYGNATILEVVGQELHFTDLENDFIVTTNFPNMLLKNNDFAAVENIRYGGADRYKAAAEYIEPRVATFTVEDGMNALECAVNTMPYSPTMYSVVCDPLHRMIYLAIRGDFAHIWKISMDDLTVETFQGFTKPMTYEVYGEGIPLRLLEAYALEDAQAEERK